MKVKLFWDVEEEGGSDRLEEVINNFIQNKKVIDVKYTTNTQNNPSEGIFSTTLSVLILYEDT